MPEARKQYPRQDCIFGAYLHTLSHSAGAFSHRSSAGYKQSSTSLNTDSPSDEQELSTCPGRRVILVSRHLLQLPGGYCRYHRLEHTTPSEGGQLTPTFQQTHCPGVILLQPATNPAMVLQTILLALLLPVVAFVVYVVYIVRRLLRLDPIPVHKKGGVLVTGVSSGLGRHAAKSLADMGYGSA